MPKFVVRLMNGDSMTKEADHYKVDSKKGQIVLYKSKTEPDTDLLLFTHGVISIEPAQSVPTVGIFMGAAKTKQPY